MTDLADVVMADRLLAAAVITQHALDLLADGIALDDDTTGASPRRLLQWVAHYSQQAIDAGASTERADLTLGRATGTISIPMYLELMKGT